MSWLLANRLGLDAVGAVDIAPAPPTTAESSSIAELAAALGAEVDVADFATNRFLVRDLEQGVRKRPAITLPEGYFNDVDVNVDFVGPW